MEKMKTSVKWDGQKPYSQSDNIQKHTGNKKKGKKHD